MAVLNNPANGSTHRHMQAGSNTFTWSNTNPVVGGNPYWRLKIGSAPFGYNYFLGTPVQTLSDSAAKPQLTAKCYATVEWSTTANGPWSNGGTYTWYNWAP